MDKFICIKHKLGNRAVLTNTCKMQASTQKEMRSK